jgi:curved DNA-binding protein
VYSEASVDLYTAVLGGETQIQTLGGDVMLTIPPGTQPGKLFRLAGKGMPQVKNTELRGDQLVRIKVKIPQNLTAQQRDLFQKLVDLGS